MNNEIKYLLHEMITSIEIVATIEELDNIPRNKSISFTNENEEILIFDRDYLKENDLCKDLWYTLQEMNQFKQEAIIEIQIFMMLNPGICNKDAMKIMWSSFCNWE